MKEIKRDNSCDIRMFHMDERRTLACLRGEQSLLNHKQLTGDSTETISDKTMNCLIGASSKLFNILRVYPSLLLIVTFVLFQAISTTESCYVFPPGKKNPCDGVTCNIGAICVSTMDGEDHRCQCQSECNDYGDSEGSMPICGSNGKDYRNWCELQRESCHTLKEIKIKYYGKCDPCDGVVCEGHKVCQLNNDSDRDPVCKCETSCEPIQAPVCGSDGHSYSNECMLRQMACETKKEITVRYSGDCRVDNNPDSPQPQCLGVQCNFDAVCKVTDGIPQCVCPTCRSIYDPLCGDNGISYQNECDMRRENCLHQKNIRIEHRGLCTNEGCDKNKTVCQFYSICDTSGSHPRCVCPSECDKTIAKVCGTDGVTYNSECELRVASCKQQENIFMYSFGHCEDCNGIKCQHGAECINGRCRCPKVCPSTDQPVCGSDMKTYQNECEMMKEACKKGIELHVVDSGECDPLYTGSGDQCHCNSMGSKGSNCNPVSKQCMCRDGVGGLKCDRCMPGFWGLHLIRKQNRNGCIKCNCHEYGSSRSDCHQMTGRCQCNPGYEGPKCDRCVESGARAGRFGCQNVYIDPTPVPFTTGSRKTTRHIHASNYMTNMTPEKPRSTERPSLTINDRIGNVCLEDSYCDVPNSECRQSLCRCKEGYIPTMGNTQCSAVKVEPTHVVHEDFNTCTLNPCLYGGVCVLDDNLGYRCLCALGRSGIICKTGTSFVTPSFSGSSYLMLKPLGNISGDFYLDITFHAMNKDGIILYTSQSDDGTGQFVSIAISDGHVEFRFDMGNGPVQIRHPHPIVRRSYHQVIAKKIGMNAMLVVDGLEPVAAISIGEEKTLSLLGKLYLGYVPQNLSFIQEKIGVNLGFVGCIQSLSAGQVDKYKSYRLDYPNPNTEILDGLDVGPCERNPCQSLPCLNGGSCIILNADIYQCLCPKGHSGENCEGPVNLCTHSPCHQSATCSISDLGDIICHCPEGREGLYCEYEKLPEIPVPLFTGNSYMILHVHDILAVSMSVEMWFLTTERNGMLLVSSQFLNGLGDFISLNIDDLYLEFRYDLGDGVVVIRSAERIELNHWHRVVIQRTNREGELIMDGGDPYKGTSPGELTELQLAGSLYIGGFKDKFDLPIDSKISKNFSGAIQRIYLNGRLIDNPEDNALEKQNIGQYMGQPCNMNPCLNGGVCVPKLEQSECKCPKRYIGLLCEKLAENLETDSPIRFSGTTYLQYFNDITLGIKAQKSNKFQFRFRTHQKHGMIIFQSQGPGVSGDYFTIVISSSYIEMSYNLGKQTQENLFRVRSTVYVSDGQWHSVFAERDRRTALLQVDNEPMISAESAPGATQLDTDGMLWIGGKSDIPHGLPVEYRHGFKGCLGNVYLENRELNLYEHRNGPSSIDFCH